MRKLSLIVAITLLLFISQSTHVFAVNENVSKTIDHIEIGENCKTIYYTDGSKEMFVTCSVNVNVDFSTTVHMLSIPVPSPPKPPDLGWILEIIKEFFDLIGAGGVGCALLAWKIWNYIKSLNRNRPQDPYGVSTTSSIIFLSSLTSLHR